MVLSSVWRVWAAKHKPDLYIAVRGMGQIKASVHCPNENTPTWKRHFGFEYGADGEVASAVRSEGKSRHQAEWPGASIGHGKTIEWRIFVRGPSLKGLPTAPPKETLLVRPPNAHETLIFIVALGAQNDHSEFPKASDAETNLLATGNLSDGRRVWITFCYTPLVTPPIPDNKNPRQYGSAARIRSAKDTLRAFTIHPIQDGSLGFFEWHVELTDEKTISMR